VLLAQTRLPEICLAVSNQKYWIPKITANDERDKRNYQVLNDLGWKVLIVWECELKSKEKEKTLRNIVSELEKKYECYK